MVSNGGGGSPRFPGVLQTRGEGNPESDRVQSSHWTGVMTLHLFPVSKSDDQRNRQVPWDGAPSSYAEDDEPTRVLPRGMVLVERRAFAVVMVAQSVSLAILLTILGALL